MTALVGKVVEKRGKALGIEVEEEQGKPKKIFFGRGAIKGDAESGYFIPDGFTKDKLTTPTKIILPDFDAELEVAPVVELKGNGEHEHKEEGDGEKAQRRGQNREEIIAQMMKTYLQKGREMVHELFMDSGLSQAQLAEMAQDVAVSMFIEHGKREGRRNYDRA